MLHKSDYEPSDILAVIDAGGVQSGRDDAVIGCSRKS
jgi:hypothetical protein